MRGLAVVIVPLVVITGCELASSFERPTPGLERMLEQPRHDPYEAYRGSDGSLTMMQLPPEGVIPYEPNPRSTSWATGQRNDEWVVRIPAKVDLDFVRRGRADFSVYCAVCHGESGDGASAVARHMNQKKPPSLHAGSATAMPVGWLYSVVSNGKNYMPAMNLQLSQQRRWQVVAYVRALQLSRRLALGERPVNLRGLSPAPSAGARKP